MQEIIKKIMKYLTPFHLVAAALFLFNLGFAVNDIICMINGIHSFRPYWALTFIFLFPLNVLGVCVSIDNWRTSNYIRNTKAEFDRLVKGLQDEINRMEMIGHNND